MSTTLIPQGFNYTHKKQDVFENIDIAKGTTTPNKADVLGRGNSGGYPHFLFSINNPFVDHRWVNQFLYETVSWVYICAQKIANSAEKISYSVVPVKKKNKVPEGIEEFIEELEDFLEDANEEQDFDEIYRQVQLDLSINGKAYIVFEFLEKRPPFRTPTAMYRIDFRTMEPVRLYWMAEMLGVKETEYKKKRNRLLGWKQQIYTGDDLESFLEAVGLLDNEVKTLDAMHYLTSEGENVRYFYPEQVLEIKLDASGTSPLDCLEFALVTEISAHQYTYSYLRNSTKTGMVFSMGAKGKVNRGDAAINKQWLKDEYSNPDTAWQPMILIGDIQLVRDSASTADVQYLDIRKFNLVEVCAAMGVDPQSIYSEAKTTEKEEGENIFEESTVIPRSFRVLKRFTRFLYKIYPEMKGKFKIIPGVKGRSSLHVLNIAQKLCMSGGTVNESRDLIGLPDIKTDEIYDKPLVAANILPLELVEKMADQKAIGSNPQRDNNPAGQPRGETPQDGQTGRTNEQR